MEKLNDTCREFEGMLAELSNKCEGLIERMHKFEEWADSLPRIMLCATLAVVGAQVDGALKSLDLARPGEGHLYYILLSIEEGISVARIDKEELVLDKAKWGSFGYEVLDPLEFANMIKAMGENLDSGNWARVVQWVNTYGRYPPRKYDTILGHLILVR